VADALLEVRGLYKHFGGVVATDRLDLAVAEGGVHALIGPNGAGKTTLIAQICGEVEPDSGQVLFAGRDITGLPAHERVGLGLGRSFQITRVFRSLTARDNVALAVQARSGSSMRFWRPVAAERTLFEEADAVLAGLGMRAASGLPAASLPHADQRRLEVAIALACRPRLLLLDEPLAGMGAEEAQAMVGVIGQVKQHTTILMVEHDMDAVFRLADEVSVLVGGRVIASGAPQVIRDDPEVRRAYLGEEEDPAAA
jgi:branched-chain amino acid transport system ATP-binding protein